MTGNISRWKVQTFAFSQSLYANKSSSQPSAAPPKLDPGVDSKPYIWPPYYKYVFEKK